MSSIDRGFPDDEITVEHANLRWCSHGFGDRGQ